MKRFALATVLVILMVALVGGISADRIQADSVSSGLTGTVRGKLSPRESADAVTESPLPSALSSANVDVMLIIDSSGSMSANDPANKRLDAAKAYLTASIDLDRVGVVD